MTLERHQKIAASVIAAVILTEAVAMEQRAHGWWALMLAGAFFGPMSWTRGADIATVFSLPIGAIALGIAAWQQYRVSQELRRRPKIVFGFQSRRDDKTRKVEVWGTETTLQAVYDEGEHFSKPVEFQFLAANVGDKMATHLLWNVDFPLDVKVNDRSSGWEKRFTSERGQTLIPDCATLNPHDVSRMIFRIQVPASKSKSKVTITAGVSSAETIDQVTEFTLNMTR